MSMAAISDIEFVDADEALKARIGAEWGVWAARHMHVSDGFSIVALHNGDPVGLISIVWQELPRPLVGSTEAFIDIIDVREAYRRKGIARRMIEMVLERAASHGACQVRAWSSEDKAEAIPMWHALGFGLYPRSEHIRGREMKGYVATRRCDIR